jgi:ATP-dependent RNA helicase SUPV3L1/SUV3
MLEAEITTAGDVLVEGQHVGRLAGFRFEADTTAEGTDIKALRSAAAKALAGEIAERAEKVATSPNGDFVLASDGTLRWRGGVIARIADGDSVLKPRFILLADDALSSGPRERVQARIDLWLANRIETLLKPLIDLGGAESLSPAARGIAFRLVENLGVVDRAEIADEVRGLDQESRAGMRALGVRFGAHHIYVPALLKPGPGALLAVLWSVKHGGLDQAADLSRIASSGRTSVKLDPAIPRPLYRVVGYRVAGNMAVRVDIIERLADYIRPLIAWRPTPAAPTPPEGAVDGNGFRVTVTMTSLLGCSGEDFASVLRALGYRMERKPAPPPQAAIEPAGASPPTGTVVAEPASADAAAATEDPADQPAGDLGESGDAAIDTVDAVEIMPESVAAKVEAVVTEVEATVTEEAAAPADPEPAAGDVSAEAATAATTAATAEEVEAAASSPVDGDSTITAAVAAGEASAEPAFIEIWRPHRAGRRPDQRNRGRPRPAGEVRPVGDARPEGQPAPVETRDSRPPRHERRKDMRRSERPEGNQRGRPQHHGPRKDGQDRPQRPERQERQERPERQKQADPLSPFAALAALKAQLEAQKRDG